MILAPPLPSLDDIAMAQTSPEERLRVDRMYAAACGLEGGAVDVFLQRVALFDVRTQIAQEEATVAYLEQVRKAKETIVQQVERPARVSRRLPRPRPAA